MTTASAKVSATASGHRSAVSWSRAEPVALAPRLFHGILRQHHAHGAGVGDGGEGQPGADAGRRATSARAPRSAEDAATHDAAGDEADLAFEVPGLAAAVDGGVGRLPADDAAVEDAGGRGRPGAGSARPGRRGRRSGRPARRRRRGCASSARCSWSRSSGTLKRRGCGWSRTPPGCGRRSAGGRARECRRGARQGGGVDGGGGCGSCGDSCRVASVRGRPAVPAWSKASSMATTSCRGRRAGGGDAGPVAGGAVHPDGPAGTSSSRSRSSWSGMCTAPSMCVGALGVAADVEDDGAAGRRPSSRRGRRSVAGR